MRHTEQEETCAHEAMALLPWYVNGTLGSDERRAVEDHLATCALCPDELVALLKVQSVLRREGAEAPEPSAALLQKVKGRIAEAPAVTDQSMPGARHQQDRSTWAWLAHVVHPALRPGWALAALVLLTVQTAVIVGLVARGPSGGIPEYRTLTGPPISGQPSGPRVRLRVAFVEQAPERSIRAALGELHATIVDGPSAAGFYVIDVPLDGSAVRTPEEAVRTLRERHEVIRFAESAVQ
ncbi:MAG: zf-HC2 domain-containing protein [candidate division NC10 bacterium]|nr:zf-HC2 domain-containing protein [candidate division NC10 bacterium]